MNLQARQIEGGLNSAVDRLEVILDYNQALINGGITHSIEMVSGPAVTHGGGGKPGETLHYKSYESDNDVIDYSSIEMEVVQSEKGVSVIKVVAVYTLQSDMDDFEIALNNWLNEPESDTKDPEAPLPPLPRTVKTGDITLTYQDSTFV